MKTFIIAAAAAALIGSTSVSLAEGDSGREVYQSALSFNQQQAANQQVNTVRNARAEANHRAVNSFAAQDSTTFDRNVSSPYR